MAFARRGRALQAIARTPRSCTLHIDPLLMDVRVSESICGRGSEGHQREPGLSLALGVQSPWGANSDCSDVR